MTSLIRAGCSPFAADRQHLHHLLLGCGLSDGRVTALLLLMALLMGAVGVAAYRLDVPEYWQFYAFLAVFWLYFRVTSRLWAQRQNQIHAGSERRHGPHLIELPKADLVSESLNRRG